MDNSNKGKLGELFVKEFLTKRGYRILSEKRNGSDIIAQKAKSTPIAIEVKTTGNLLGGIPDMHLTEFEEMQGKWMFVADYLYILRLDKNGQPIQLDILNKKEIDNFADSHKLVRRIRTTKLDRAIKNKLVGKSINF